MGFLPQADLILVLVDGEITESGSYQELLSRKGAFADFIRTFATSERKESTTQKGTFEPPNGSPVLSCLRTENLNKTDILSKALEIIKCNVLP